MSRERVGKLLPPVLVFVALVAIWELVIGVLGVPTFVVPAPHAIVARFVGSYRDMLSACLVTMSEAVAGFVIGGLLGILIAILFFYFPRAENALIPLVTAANSVPPVAFAPLAVIWFGVGPASKIALAGLASFVAIMINTLQGLRCYDPLKVTLLRSFGATEAQIFPMLRWPSALPHVFVGLRNASITVVIVSIVAEMLSAAQGVGMIINITTQLSDFLRMWTAVMSISAFGVLFYLIVYALERQLAWWLEET
jgi:NitT/TauT family transport system permease protein